MKRMLWMVLLALALPMMAFADNSVDFTNSGGTLSGSSAGLSLSGSELIAVNGLNGMSLVTGDLGSMSFSTGGMTSGNLQMGATFAAGGTFQIMGNGSNGIPNGVLFNGAFDGPVTWTLITLANGTHGDGRRAWRGSSARDRAATRRCDAGPSGQRDDSAEARGQVRRCRSHVVDREPATRRATGRIRCPRDG